RSEPERATLIPPVESKRISRLAPLETFDVNAFVGDQRTPQHVCDFVLALAVAFNDLRDLITAQQVVRDTRPRDIRISPELGEYYGLHAHWIRMMIGVLKALTEVISENERAMNDPFFRGLLKSLSKTYREAWEVTVNAALATTAKGDRFGRMLFFARNKVAFHYDPKEISRGYQLKFMQKGDSPPYVSRDDAMEGTRFYFADASAEEYLLYASGAADGKEFFDSGWAILPDISHAIREIVIRYVNARGYGWRSVAT
ncbi:MAG TPA: hypothetical protein VMU84_16640, partial [Thermoanaerobaculia bacterium]|nr:hypothetical protein [Thermoanaerobaculia bacterium]